MNELNNILENIGNLYSDGQVTRTVILSVVLMVAIMSVYEFIVYRFISHRTFYNKSFNIAIAVIPFFIATIILCLQSNIVITLGTIGALAIIRFRTAVKDPVDMLYLLWSVHIGICCGCQLYEVAVITSIAVTIGMVVFDKLAIGRKPFILVVHMKNAKEEVLTSVLEQHTKGFRVKSRNLTSKGADYAIEAKVRDPRALTDTLRATKEVDKFSVIEYDADDIV